MPDYDIHVPAALRDGANVKMTRTTDELAQLDRLWPEHMPGPVVDANRQLRELAEAWIRVKYWATREIRRQAERELI